MLLSFKKIINDSRQQHNNQRNTKHSNIKHPQHTDIGLLVKDKADRVEREKEETAAFSYTRASYRILQR